MAELKGNKYGTHRVIEPKGVLTQAAWKIDNDMSKVYSNEIVCDVTSLNIDSASFTQISEACGGDEKKIGEMILGANGKSGVLCGWEAMKKVGPKGKVVGVVRNPKQVPGLMELGVYTDVIVADCTKPVEVMEAALAANDGKEYDLSICCVNIESCEMSAILPVRDDGLVYFFSMATSFTKAALGAEGIGKDVTMIIGNGYTKNHAQITLDVLRENPKLRKLFDEKYC